MNESNTRYAERGVSSSKADVHAAIQHLDKGLYPGAFCKILPDHLGGDPRFCNIQHGDGAGTKAGLAYLAHKRLKDISFWRGVVRDSMFMNLDDVACAGSIGPFLISSAIDRNKVLVGGDVVSIIISETQAVCDDLSRHNIPCIFSGGETADVGDLVRTITVNHTVTTRFLREKVIDAARIEAPALIVGFSSTGKATYEDRPNSGIGSNGLTNARHDTLFPEYREDTETYAPETSIQSVYCGEYGLDAPLPGDDTFTIAEALLSPTRTYLPILKTIFEAVDRKEILGLIHCSGGGQTKIGKFGPKGVRYVKDSLFPIPPLFAMLKDVRGLPWKEMYTSYNMGHRLEAIVRSENVAKHLIKISDIYGVDAKIVGRVEQGGDSEAREVVIRTGEGEWSYQFE